MFLDDLSQPQAPIATDDANDKVNSESTRCHATMHIDCDSGPPDYVTKTVVLTALETGKDTIDVGTAVMEPQNPARPIAE